MVLLLLAIVFTLMMGYSMILGASDSFVSPPEKKKKCEKCKKEDPLEGSDLCYYCEIVEFRQYQQKKRAEKAKA